MSTWQEICNAAQWNGNASLRKQPKCGSKQEQLGSIYIRLYKYLYKQNAGGFRII
jgi:hypothetical protein